MADRMAALWKRMAEMFGAETLSRKFGDQPPDTWRVAVNRLSESEAERGLRRLVYGGKAHVPTLPEFLRMCRSVGGEEFADADRKPAPPSQQLTHQDQPRWEREANLHLMAHLMRRALSGIHYTTERMRRNPVPQRIDYESQALIQPLIDAKKAWAEDMRDAEMSGKLPADNGKEWWQYAMKNADEQVDRVRMQQEAA